MSSETELLANPMTTALSVEGRAPVTPRTTVAPGSDAPATDEGIRLSAYLKWMAAGRPDGDGVEFWLTAEKELLSQPASNGRRRARRPSKPR